jgi:D-apionolactonase
MLPLNVLRWGREEDQPEAVPLRAGPLSARYEEGGLRYIRLGDREILRRVYVAVRDRNWGTIIPSLSDVRIERGDDRFRIGFLAEHREGPIDFAWRGTISGDPGGTITFAMDGEARTTFLRNRIGFCVLHPPGPCAGAPCVVEHDGGTRTEGAFPVPISPHQPFFEMRAIAHEVAPGVWAEVRFAGDIFEMEDQRNWTDDSYKTYCTPLREPFPVEVAAGTRVAQSVTLTLQGARADQSGEPEGTPVTVAIGEEAVGALPRLGLGAATHGEALGDGELARLRTLGLAHLRVDLRLAEVGWREALGRAAAEAGALGVGLEIAFFLSDAAGEELTALAAALGELRPAVVRWLVFHIGEVVTAGHWIAFARQHLGEVAPGVPFGGGTNAYFTELNRNRPDPGPLDLVAYSINPQVHAFDDTSLVETLACQATTVESARAFIGDLPLAISPVTLRPRFNPNATAAAEAPPPDALPSEVDPRQMALFGAAWTVGSLAVLAASGVASVTYYETTGARGVIETPAGAPWPAFRSLPGGVFPLYHALADAGEFAGGAVLRATTSDPLGATALALRDGVRTRILLANLRPTPQRIALRLAATRARVRRLDETNAEEAMRSPETFRAKPGELVEVRDGMLALDLLPYALARIDAGGD